MHLPLCLANDNGLSISWRAVSTYLCYPRLAELDMDYIDLLLLHTPGNPKLRAETWHAMESAYNQVFIFTRILLYANQES